MIPTARLGCLALSSMQEKSTMGECAATSAVLTLGTEAKVRIPLKPLIDTFAHTIAAQKRIRELESLRKDAGRHDKMYAQEIARLGIAYQLASSQTLFVAIWDGTDSSVTQPDYNVELNAIESKHMAYVRPASSGGYGGGRRGGLDGFGGRRRRGGYGGGYRSNSLSKKLAPLQPQMSSSPAYTPLEPSGGSSSVQNVQTQLDEVTSIVQDNVSKLLARGGKLSNKSGLAASSEKFKRTANKVRSKMWWQNMKMNAILAGVIGILLLALVLAILFQTGVLRTGGSTAAPATSSASSSGGSAVGITTTPSGSSVVLGGVYKHLGAGRGKFSV
ncbi:synaptobrevin-domain-containing protein [Cladochytrium replicatum]|nr:synaptobrevin-domain-containing protein [Cladochytrium replicatum]